MVSGCEVLEEYPERFVIYLVSNPDLRSKITDRQTFNRALRLLLTSDPALQGIVEDIESRGGSVGECAEAIWNSSTIQKLVGMNYQRKLTKFKNKVKKQHKGWGKARLEKEAIRRTKISNSLTARRGFEKAVQPASKITFVDAKRIEATGAFSRMELRLLKNNKGKPFDDVLKTYYASGFPYRKPETIKEEFEKL